MATFVANYQSAVKNQIEEETEGTFEMNIKLATKDRNLNHFGKTKRTAQKKLDTRKAEQ